MPAHIWRPVTLVSVSRRQWLTHKINIKCVVNVRKGDHKPSSKITSVLKMPTVNRQTLGMMQDTVDGSTLVGLGARNSEKGAKIKDICKQMTRIWTEWCWSGISPVLLPSSFRRPYTSPRDLQSGFGEAPSQSCSLSIKHPIPMSPGS